jgi:hypothetical protein
MTVETNTFILQLVCHDLRVSQLAVGDPLTQTLKPLDRVGEGETDTVCASVQECPPRRVKVKAVVRTADDRGTWRARDS